MKQSKFLRLAVGVLAFGLVAAACSDDDDDAASTTTVAATVEVYDGADDTSTDDQPAGSIVDIAVADGRFTTLVAAVEAAGLADQLSGEGSFTVFAPTDDAFEALPEGTVEELLQDPEGALTDILTYHVIDGAVLAEDVVALDGQTVATLSGGEVTIGVTDDGVTLTDATGQTANVIVTDIVADNGVIHVIDAVLLPAA